MPPVEVSLKINSANTLGAWARFPGPRYQEQDLGIVPDPYPDHEPGSISKDADSC